MKVCEICGASFDRAQGLSIGQWRKQRFCSNRCAWDAQRKPRECGCGCGGRQAVQRKYLPGHRPKKLAADGYMAVYGLHGHPMAGRDGRALEHRVVLYDAGVEIPDGWHVHHRNGVKHDNRLENLEVLPPAAHVRGHIEQVGYVVNQYGCWPLRSAASRQEQAA